MDFPVYAGSIERNHGEAHAENISVIDMGAVGDGATDDAPAFNAAILRLQAKRLSHLHVPGGTYLLNSMVDFPADDLKITMYGDGESTILLRGAALNAGEGLLNIRGSNISIQRMVVDGQVTTSVGKEYGTMTGVNGSDDPMHADLTLNTSIWIHEDVENIRITEVKITHTGGYSILIDARDADIDNVSILDCRFENNRPHLFGTIGDLNYGSWTGGIHYQGDCRVSEPKLFCVRDLLVQGCTFKRNTGNCLWGHLYAFDKLHENIRAIGNHFIDCGLDGILVGGVSGGVVEGCTFRRIGYVCSDDTSPSVPKFLANAYAVGLDTSGIVKGVNYVGNSFQNCNGGCMDLDGFGEGTVSGNTCRQSIVGEPEYTEDSVASLTTSYGCQPSNTANKEIPSKNVNVIGNTFINLSRGSIAMMAARRCLVKGNMVYHTASPSFPPIMLGNVGTGLYQRAYDNVVTQNYVHYAFSNVPAIFEFANTFAFDPADRNYVFDNKIIGGAHEFESDPNTASFTGYSISTSDSSVATYEAARVEVTGTGATAAYRILKRIGAVETLLMNLDFTTQSLTISGIAGQTTIKALGGFMESDQGFITFAVSDEAVKAPGTSGSGQGGMAARKFSIYRADGGATGWDTVIDASRNGWLSQLVVGTVSPSGGAGVISAEVGFYTPAASDEAVKVTGTSGSGPGGVAARKFSIYRADGGATGWDTVIDVSRNAAFAQVVAGTVSPSGGPGVVSAENGFYSPVVSSEGLKLPGVSGSGGGGATVRQLNIYKVDGGATGWDTVIDGNRNAAFLGCTAGAVASAGSGVFTALVGFSSPGTSYQTINLTAGGGNAQSFRAEKYMTTGQSNGVPSATVGDTITRNGAFYYDTGLSKFRAYQAGSWVDMIGGGGGTPGGANTNVQYNNAGAFGGSANLTWNGTQLNITGAILIGGTQIVTSARAITNVISINTTGSNATIQSTSTGTNIAFQTGTATFTVTGAGNVGCQLVNTNSVQIGGTTVIDVSRNLTNIGYLDAASYADAASGFRVNGTEVISSARSITNIVNATITGYLDAVSYVDALGGFKINGTSVITSGGVFDGLGVAMTSYGCGASGFSVYSSGWYYGVAGPTTFTTTDAKTVTVRGGIIVSVV